MGYRFYNKICKNILDKKKGRISSGHAHQAVGNMGGRGKCSRHIYYRLDYDKTLIKKIKILN